MAEKIFLTSEKIIGCRGSPPACVCQRVSGPGVLRRAELQAGARGGARPGGLLPPLQLPAPRGPRLPRVRASRADAAQGAGLRAR